MPGPRPSRRSKTPHSSPSRKARAARFRKGAAEKDSAAGAKAKSPRKRPPKAPARSGGTRPAEKRVAAATVTESAVATPRAGEVIRSDQNPAFKVWRSLLTGRGVRKRGRAIIAGRKVVDEVAAEFGGLVEACLVPESDPQPPAGLPTVVRCYRLPAKLLRELDPGDAGPPLLVVRVPEMPEWRPQSEEHADGCTLFLPFQDPVNVGAVLRSAAAFGVHRAVMLKESAHPFHPRSLQAAGGAPLRLMLMRGPALADLRTGDLPCFTLDLGGEPLRGFRFPERFGLVPGLEGTGLPNLAGPHTPVYIPISPNMESLNAATATAIALYHWRAHVADLE